MRRLNGIITAGLALSAVLATSGASHAQTNFANFQTQNTQFLLYTNNPNTTGVGSDSLSLGLSNGVTVNPASSLLVAFAYQTANGYNGSNFAFQNILANLTVTGTNSANVITGSNGNSQDFTNFQIRFTTANNATAANGQFVAAGANLLTVTATSTPTLAGATLNITGAQVGSIDGSQTFPSAASYTIGYSSDFLDFSQATTQRNYSISLNNITTNSGSTSGVPVNNGEFDSFRANFTGQFGSTPLPTQLNPTPAPPGVVSGLIGIAMGGAQFGMMKFRGRRRAKKTQAAEVAA